MTFERTVRHQSVFVNCFCLLDLSDSDIANLSHSIHSWKRPSGMSAAQRYSPGWLLFFFFLTVIIPEKAMLLVLLDEQTHNQHTSRERADTIHIRVTVKWYTFPLYFSHAETSSLLAIVLIRFTRNNFHHLEEELWCASTASHAVDSLSGALRIGQIWFKVYLIIRVKQNKDPSC